MSGFSFQKDIVSQQRVGIRVIKVVDRININLVYKWVHLKVICILRLFTFYFLSCENTVIKALCVVLVKFAW
jgi:hypothetical protein